MIRLVSVTSEVDTISPLDGKRDRNTVRVSWTPSQERGLVVPERIHLIVANFRRREMHCEDLADEIALRVRGAIDYTVMVVVQQRPRRGHGVTASAVVDRGIVGPARDGT